MSVETVNLIKKTKKNTMDLLNLRPSLEEFCVRAGKKGKSTQPKQWQVDCLWTTIYVISKDDHSLKNTCCELSCTILSLRKELDLLKKVLSCSRIKYSLLSLLLIVLDAILLLMICNYSYFVLLLSLSYFWNSKHTTNRNVLLLFFAVCVYSVWKGLRNCMV